MVVILPLIASVLMTDGETVTVGILIPDRAFEHWSADGWTQEPGTFTLAAGSSSASLPLTGSWQKTSG